MDLNNVTNQGNAGGDAWAVAPPSPPSTPASTRRADTNESTSQPPPYEEIDNQKNVKTENTNIASVHAAQSHSPPPAPLAQQAPPPPPPLPPPAMSPLASMASAVTNISTSVGRSLGLLSPPSSKPQASDPQLQLQQQQTPSPRAQRQSMSKLFMKRPSAKRSLKVEESKLHRPSCSDKPINEKLSLITMLVDRSGSMRSMGPEVAGGVNAYLDEQRKTDSEDDRTTHVILSIFDDRYEVVRSAPLSEQPAVTDEEVNPRGMTALNDAIGKAIKDTVDKLDTMSEVPGTVVVFILTDGEENSSKLWSADTVKAQIKILEAEPFEWEFYFAAANQNAITSGARIGITNESCLTYAASPAGIRTSMQCASESVSRMKRQSLSAARSRKSQRYATKSFTMDERAMAMAAPQKK